VKPIAVPEPTTAEPVAPRTSSRATLEPRLIGLAQAYVAYLSGCGLCVNSTVAAGSAHDEDPRRLLQLPIWRGARLGTYTDREMAALVWAEVMVVAGVDGALPAQREQALALFTRAELDRLSRILTAARGWRRLQRERAGLASNCDTRQNASAAHCPDAATCELCAA
jgi:alkylhydroperoxidase family enzyme